MIAPSSPLESVIQHLGYRSADDFLHIQLRNVLEQKIAYYQSRVDFFHLKYDMSFDEFRRRVVEEKEPVLSRFGIFEKENDDNDWDDAMDFLADYTDCLNQIRP